MFNESLVLHIFKSLNINGGFQAIFGIYYLNNAFLGMFQLLETFKTCSLLRENLFIVT